MPVYGNYIQENKTYDDIYNKAGKHNLNSVHSVYRYQQYLRNIQENLIINVYYYSYTSGLHIKENIIIWYVQ